MDTITGNKLIAEFMGKQDVLGVLDTEPFVTNVWFSADQIESKMKQGLRVELYYHTSWDWLMPVVEKIFLSGQWDYSIVYMGCSINGDHEQPPYIFEEGETTIEATWKAVIRFIQWHKNKTS